MKNPGARHHWAGRLPRHGTAHFPANPLSGLHHPGTANPLALRPGGTAGLLNHLFSHSRRAPRSPRLRLGCLTRLFHEGRASGFASQRAAGAQRVEKPLALVEDLCSQCDHSGAQALGRHPVLLAALGPRRSFSYAFGPHLPRRAAGGRAGRYIITPGWLLVLLSETIWGPKPWAALFAAGWLCRARVQTVT